MFRHTIIALIISLSLHTFSADAHANEIDLTGALAAGASSRSGDGVAHGTLRGRYAWHPNIAVALTLIGGAAGKDERSIGALSLAGQLGKTYGRWRPAVRIGFIHQHETAREDFEDNPLSVTLGVNEAIGHRTGALAEVGATVDLFRLGSGSAFAAADLGTHLMFDGNGPRSYTLLSLGVGYRLGSAP